MRLLSSAQNEQSNVELKSESHQSPIPIGKGSILFVVVAQQCNIDRGMPCHSKSILFRVVIGTQGTSTSRYATS